MNRTSEIEDLLVPYVNGTATRDDARRAEEAIRGDPAMAAELNFLSSLRAAAKIPLGETPGQFGLDRLRRTLERHRREQRRLRLWRSLTAFVATLLVGVVVLNLSAGRGDAVYQSLQGQSRAAIQVRFQPVATSLGIQDLLRNLGLEVVSGPSAAGVYRLQLREPAGPDSRVQTLARLREQPALVEFAELEP